MDFIDDQGRAAAALEIKKAMRRGPSGRMLQKHVSQERTRLGKGRWRRLAEKIAAVVKGDELRKSARDVGSAGLCSLKAIRITHDAGPRLETPDQEYLRKLSAPPQSWNGRNDNAVADDGATLGTQRQSAPDAKPTRLGPSHAASMSDGRPQPEDKDVDPTVAALKAIFKAGPKREL